MKRLFFIFLVIATTNFAQIYSLLMLSSSLTKEKQEFFEDFEVQAKNFYYALINQAYKYKSHLIKTRKDKEEMERQISEMIENPIQFFFNSFENQEKCKDVFFSYCRFLRFMTT